jgi:repressor LexA
MEVTDMKNKLTRMQKRVLNFISSCIRKDGIPPTLREIRDHLGLSSLASPRHHLKKLAEKGYIKLKSSASRGIELMTGIPVLGEISAGFPLEALENVEGYFNISRTFPEAEDIFCLRVKGDSMEGAGIMDGDLVIVKKQSAAESGQIVVALSAGEALVKRLVRRGCGFILKAENPSYEDINVREASIIGRVTGVIRSYDKIQLY